MSLRINTGTQFVYSVFGGTNSPASSNPVTFSIWARMNQSTSQGELFCILDSTLNQAEGWWSRWENDVTGFTQWEGASIIGGDSTIYTPETGLGNWHHLAWTIGTDNVYSAYYDGTFLGSKQDVRIASWPLYVAIGIPENSGAMYIVGDASQARFWSAKLTQAEIVAEMNSTTAVRTTSLYGDWPLSTTLNDQSALGNTLLQGSTGPLLFVDDPPGVGALTGAIATQASSTATLTVPSSLEVMPFNGQASALVGAILATATTLAISSSDVASWPTAGSYRAILWQDATNGPWEIVRVTGGPGTATLTVTRAVESTGGIQTARAWPSGTPIAGIATYGGLNALVQQSDVRTSEAEFVPAAAATTVVLSAAPEQVFMVSRQGVIQSQAAGHYSIAGSTLTFASSFSGSERVIVSYSVRG